MSDKIFIAFGLGGFNTSPGGVLYVRPDGEVDLDRVYAFNEARVVLNAGANYRRILRRGLVAWGAVVPFDWKNEDGSINEKYWPLMREYLQIIHQPYQDGSGPGAGARILFEIFDGCSESWFYDPANYGEAQELIWASFNNLGDLDFVDFGLGNETNAMPEARTFARNCALPVFKSAGWLPLSYGGTHQQRPDYSVPGPCEAQKQELEALWQAEAPALFPFRQVHGILDDQSQALVDTLWLWTSMNNPIRVWYSDDGMWLGSNLCDRVLYHGSWQIRPSPEEFGRAARKILNSVQSFAMPGGGPPKFAIEHLPKKERSPKCWAETIAEVSKAYFERFGVWPENKGKYPLDWIEYVEVPICPTSGLLRNQYCPPAVVKKFVKGQEPTATCAVHKKPDCKCRYWLKVLNFKRWWDCVFGDGPKRCK